jgi:hypothetical protein
MQCRDGRTAGHGRLRKERQDPDGARRVARRTARVFKRVSVLGDISPFWVSEDQGLPIGHGGVIALTSAFAVGGAWRR